MSALRTVHRGVEIAGHTAWAFTRLTGRWLGTRLRARARRPAPGTLLGEELARLCERLGPTFLKLGQILSSRPDLVSPAVATPLARLQDQVAPFPSADLPALLDAAFGRPWADVLATLEPTPIASASIAQVHRARLHDGREVALKVRRPGILAQVERDFRLLHWMVAAVERLPPMRVVPFAELVGELEGPVRAQLDLAREARHLERFRGHFAQVERIRWPAAVPELSSSSVLVLEYLEGLRKVTASGLGPDDRKVAALAGLRALYKMIFHDGFVHADMHPGNVFVRAWGEVVLLDTGLVAELDEQTLADFVDFFFGLVNNQGELCAALLWERAPYRAPGADRDRFEAAIVELVGRHSALRSRDFEVARFVFELVETQRRHGIRGSTQFIMTVLSMVVYDGICKLLYPECDFQKEARAYLIAARYRHHRGAAVAV
jgi:ubiquinone biosynthesis protein